MGKSLREGYGLFDESLHEAGFIPEEGVEIPDDLEAYLDVETRRETVPPMFSEEPEPADAGEPVELDLPRSWWLECRGWGERDLWELRHQTEEIEETIDHAMEVIEEHPGYHPLARIGILEFARLCRLYDVADRQRYHLAFASYLAFLAQTARQYGMNAPWKTPEDAFRAFGMRYRMLGAVPFLKDGGFTS